MMPGKFILVLIMVFEASSNSIKHHLIRQFLKENNSKVCYFVLCWRTEGKISLAKSFITDKLNIMTAFLNDDPDYISEILENQKYSKIVVILDTVCPKYQETLIQASKKSLLRHKYTWLLITNNEMRERNFTEFFKKVQVRLDTILQIAIPISSEMYNLYEIYKPGLGVDIITNKIGTFIGGNLIYSTKEKSFYQSRKNLKNVLLRTGNTKNFSLEIPDEYVNELRHREIGTFAKFQFATFLLLKEIHNFTLLTSWLTINLAEGLDLYGNKYDLNRYNTTLRNAWFGNNSSGNDGGVAQLIYQEAVDIATAGGLLRFSRMTYYDFLVPYFKFSARFFFRDPGTVNPGAEVLKPFSTKTWQATIAIGLTMSLAIKLAYWIEYKFFRTNINYSGFTSIVIVISAFAQQGSTIFPYHLGGRIVYLNLLILSIFLYNYYTSSLVSSLLSTKPNVFTTIKELSNSDLKFSIEYQPYTITYILQMKDDFYVQHLNSTKIYQSGRPNFLSVEDGIAKVKQGGFAYHTEVTSAYPLIAKTFEQDEICNLNEIDFVPPGYLALLVPKHSQYTELFKISLAKERELGLFTREHNVWVTKKPTCMLSSLVVSVGKNELFLVYMILLVGMLLAVLILITEMLWYKFEKK